GRELLGAEHLGVVAEAPGALEEVLAGGGVVGRLLLGRVLAGGRVRGGVLLRGGALVGGVGLRAAVGLPAAVGLLLGGGAVGLVLRRGLGGRLLLGGLLGAVIAPGEEREREGRPCERGEGSPALTAVSSPDPGALRAVVSSAVAHRSPLRGPAARSVPAPGGAGTARSCRSSAHQCVLGHAEGPGVSTDRLPSEHRPAPSLLVPPSVPTPRRSARPPSLSRSVPHCPSTPQPRRTMTQQSRPSTPQRPAIVAHRGASAQAPENTLAAFRRAIEDGAQLLECDVHLSADGQVVVMHDETVDRTAQADSPLRTGAISDLTRAQLDTVLLANGERVPALADLLEMTTVPLFIEVKVASAAKAVTELLRALPSGSPAAASTVISFHADALAEIRRGAEVPVSSLVEQVDEQAIAVARELGAAGIGPSIKGLSLRAAEAVHEAGMAVNPWTVNTVAQ